MCNGFDRQLTRIEKTIIKMGSANIKISSNHSNTNPSQLIEKFQVFFLLFSQFYTRNKAKEIADCSLLVHFVVMVIAALLLVIQ